MKIKSIPKSGREGSVVYVNSRYGKVVRQYVCPVNPRTPGSSATAATSPLSAAAGALLAPNSRPPGAWLPPTGTS